MNTVSCFRIVVSGLLFAFTALGIPAASKAIAQNFEGVSTSQKTPHAIAEMRKLGRIEWSVERLPFVGPGPSAGVSGAGMVVCRGKIYLMGGFIPFGDEEEDARGKPGSRRTSRWAHCYDPRTQEWSRLPDMPARREYTRAIAVEDSVYVLGGACQFKGEEVPYRPFAECFRLWICPRIHPRGPSTAG